MINVGRFQAWVSGLREKRQNDVLHSNLNMGAVPKIIEGEMNIMMNIKVMMVATKGKKRKRNF